MRSVLIYVLIVFLLFSAAGCGGGGNKTEQPPAGTTAQEGKEKKAALIIETDVRGHKKPSADSAITGTYPFAEAVLILSEEGDWARVRNQKGKESYVLRKSLGGIEVMKKILPQFETVKDGPYPVFLQGNPNYVLIETENNSAWYLARDSILERPVYSGKATPTALGVDVYKVPDIINGPVKISSIIHYDFTFQENDFVALVYPKNIVPLDYNGDRASTMVRHPAAAMTYYLYTGQKWAKFGLGDKFYSRADYKAK